MSVQLLPPNPEAEAADRRRSRQWEALTRVLGDLLERETALNREAGQPVNYCDGELADVSRFQFQLIQGGEDLLARLED